MITENRAVNKVRSETGASITFALLLFLVCAALSAVVLVAATTAAGRMKNIAETDQRYYSVTSAAEYVCDILSEQSLSIITIGGKDYPFSKPMNQISDSDIKRVAVIDPESNDGPEIDGVPADGEGNEQRTYEDSGNPESESTSFSSALLGLDTGGELTLTFTDKDGKTIPFKDKDGSTKDAMAVTIKMEQKGDGSAKVSIQNKDSSDKFKILLTFGYQEWTANPPVTKIENKPVTGREVKWELNKMVSSYDARE